MADERTTTDPQQWRDLMSLPDDALLQAWNEARIARDAVRADEAGYREAASWQSLIEGAAASRFGVGSCLDRYRARFPDDLVRPDGGGSALFPDPPEA